ncbi:ankyrin repeat domain-containing protein [Wolbachia endosymbiont (group A) of Gastracanthus pulcherrimus]|uniref:ankyrin repeat domain-containing protein n=1 Tax=Wolbachia endosymbiont (group A) of Gastracanthus pulcherrimus TaxID=3066200 RepID=UPI00333F317D
MVEVARSNKNPLNILGQQKSDSNIQDITSPSGAEADPNIQNQDEKLFNILNEVAIDRNLLGNYVQRISLLLEAGANPNVQNREDGKTLLHYVAECNDTSGIRFLLEVIKANPNVRDQSGKTPLHYAAKNNCLQARELLLGAGANPNVQGQSGKTPPSEYATEDECRQAIEDSSHSLDDSHENKGNPATPDSSVGERNDCSNSSGDDSQAKPAELSDCNAKKDQGHGSDDSRGNEENPAKSPNNDNRIFKDQQKSSELLEVSSSSESEDSEDSSDYDHYDTSCGTRYSHLRYDGNINVIRKKDSFSLAKIKLNKVEREKYDSVWQKIYEIHGDLDKTCDKDEDYYKKCEEEFDEVIRQALDQGVMFTFPYKNYESFVDLMISTLQKLFLSYDTTRIPEFIERTKMSHIILGGATLNEFTQNEHDDFVNIICKDEDILSKRDKNISRLNNLAYESIVNKNNKQTHEYDFKAEIDNGHFCIEYPQDSIVEPVKIFNKAEALKDKDLNLKVGILQIGESIVRVESVGGKRNYKDILEGSIEMSFTTEVGEISIYLNPSKKGGNKIEIEIDEKSEARLNKLKAEKKSLGENCLLGGKSVLEAIEAKGFKKNGNVPTEPTETIKDDLSTNLTQVRLQQNREVALGVKLFR